MVLFDEDSQNKRIDELRKKEEEDLAKLMATRYQIPYLDLTVVPINIDALRVVNEIETREAQLAVFNEVDKKLSIGVLSPQNPGTLALLKKLVDKGYTTELFLVSHASLNKVWDRYKDLSFSFETKSGALDISNEQINDLLKEVRSIPDVHKLVEDVVHMKKSYRISRILEIILAGGIAIGASDIHIEPEENFVRLRYRLDGMLTDILEFDTETFGLLVSRIKLISNLKLNIKSAQDGRFSIKINTDEIEIRVSAIPGNYGDSVVLRILNPHSISVPLESLGIHPKLLTLITKEISRPNGMLLNTGPTGSGKTTTLYAFLRKVHTQEVKIITIEDPIEYHIQGITQTQVNQKNDYTFAGGLRSALRQDPDVIMVGEIRDEETAKIAIESALTGHLVFSTLHTNTAAGTFPRLIDLGVDPKTISSALNIAMAQRLVRTLCPDCKKESVLTTEEHALIDPIINGIVDKSYIEGVDMNKKYESIGCEKCHMTGFRGRTGIYEVVVMNEEIEKVVRENPTERDIQKAAKNQGLLTLREDGILKVLRGQTTLDELARIIDIERD